MILCPDCIVDVFILGRHCLDMLVDCIDMHNDGMLMAVDINHILWKLHRNGTLRPHKELERALETLEKCGYVISTEISDRLLGVSLNMERGKLHGDIICWCSIG